MMILQQRNDEILLLKIGFVTVVENVTLYSASFMAVTEFDGNSYKDGDFPLIF